jgi:hypothetical protein
MEYILDVDSSERDPTKHPNSNDFTVDLNRNLYNVSDLLLVSASVPVTQLTINEGNKHFEVDGTTVTLDNKVYTDGVALATDLEAKLAPPTSNVSSVVYDPDTLSLTFSNAGTSNDFTFAFRDGNYGSNTNSETGTPASVLGFPDLNASSTGGVLAGGIVDFHGPTNLLLRITSGADDMKKKVYKHDGEFLYTSRIVVDKAIGETMFYKGSDDHVEYYFHEGKFKSIDRLRFRFYFINGSKLIPYDFGNRNYILKLKFKCTLDKLIPLKEQKVPEELMRPPSHSEPEVPIHIIMGVVLVIGLMALMISKR